MSEIELKTSCPKCNEELVLEVPINKITPNVRALFEPYENITVYKITSTEIAEFITRKARFYKPEVKIEIGVKYHEKPRTKEDQPKKAFASLRIAFSDDVIEKGPQSGWFERIGQSENKVNFINDIFIGIIKKYQFSKKDLEDILGDYKQLEMIENLTGLDESKLEDIKLYSDPRRVVTNNESWIFFAARIDKVIADMLENPETDKVDGQIEIRDISPINKDNIQFLVYVHHGEEKIIQNPLIKKLLMGETKNKKK